jgi:hypothetical protein
MITKKFQYAFNVMKTTETIAINLEYSEVSRVLALLKSNDALEEALGKNLNECFIKAENEFKAEGKYHE